MDAAAPGRTERIAQVERVLEEIGAGHVSRIEVYNKLDRLEKEDPRVERDAFGLARRVWVSAHTGAGLDLQIRASPVEGGRRSFSTTWSTSGPPLLVTTTLL